ncbi:MAG: transaldolase [Omnitrophica bacterium]|nr:transaldolase [Candidatus Omnitrophota bacterium]
MGGNSIEKLSLYGQSVWLDNISRSLISGGKLKELIGRGLRGMTSNPTIFDKSISGGNEYDEEIKKFCSLEKTTFEIYDKLTTGDIQDACDLFRGVYGETGGLDGYVSLEINPKLAFKTRETIEEGKRLLKSVNRPNLMLKVPSTDEGFGAVEELTASGANINITLIFSLEQYIKTAGAYMRGIRRLLDSGRDARKVHSVASVFVSRIDTACDKLLDEEASREGNRQRKEEKTALKGKAAVANSAVIYGKFLEIFSSGEFKKLKEKGANIQRPLWGSTSAKNPAYSDIKYVTELIAKNTVNTMPGATLEAFLDHGAVREALSRDISKSADTIQALGNMGIDINTVCAKLLKDGVGAFVKSFDSLLDTIEKKSKELCKK